MKFRREGELSRASAQRFLLTRTDPALRAAGPSESQSPPPHCCGATELGSKELRCCAPKVNEYWLPNWDASEFSVLMMTFCAKRRYDVGNIEIKFDQN